MLLELRAVTKKYLTAEGHLTVLHDVDFELAVGESRALTGESGSGKSTLLHLAAGLHSPDSGRISVVGRDIGELDDAGRAKLRRGTVGVVFQQFNLIPSLDVKANLALHARLSEKLDDTWVRSLADRLGLGGLLDRFPAQLSGGQQQRVAIGRTLAAKPNLILADEPTGNLDEATGDAVLALMLELVAETGASLLMVTHSTRLADRLGRRTHLRGGRIVS